MVTLGEVTRTLHTGEEATLHLPYHYLNKHGGREARNQALQLTPFLFRGPLTDQERVFAYGDPGDEGFARWAVMGYLFGLFWEMMM